MNRLLIVAVCAVIGLCVGCYSSSTTTTPNEASSQKPSEPHEHNHPTDGPHHGHLIEPGNEEFHAELVYDNSTVMVNVLDSIGTKLFPSRQRL